MRDRLASGFLLTLMAIGSLVLWIGVPAACLWIASRITDDQTTHLQITVVLTIVGMVLFARFLFWVNKLYLRIPAQTPEPEPGDEAEEDAPRYARGPLEPILVASLVVALIALTVWFFAFAENPAHQIF
jgi:hypothetical protein